MNITPEQTAKLFKSSLTYSLLSFSMLVDRLRAVYERDSSPEVLQNCSNEINAFLGRYGSVMEADCAAISDL